MCEQRQGIRINSGIHGYIRDRKESNLSMKEWKMKIKNLKY